MWVANFGDGTVSRIDIDARRVMATIPVGAAPIDLAAPSGFVWVSTEDDRVLKIDAHTNEVVPGATIRIKSRGALSLAGDRLWVLDTFDGQVRSIDARSGLVTGSHRSLGRPRLTLPLERVTYGRPLRETGLSRSAGLRHGPEPRTIKSEGVRSVSRLTGAGCG